MPNFSQDVDFDLDPDEYLSECSSSEIKEVIEWLQENNYLDSNLTEQLEGNYSVLEQQFIESLKLLKENYFKLSPEDQETIERISQTFK